MTGVSEKMTAAETLVYEYQKRRLENEYSDFEGMDDVIGLFFGYYYPPPEERGEFEKLKRAYVRTIKNPLLRLICSRWVTSRLEEIAELDGLTRKLNRAVAAELAELDPPPDAVDDDLYFRLSRRAVTRAQRERQVRCAVGGLELGAGVILHFPLNIQQIIRRIPRPLVRNRDLFDLAVETYLVFHSHKKNLAEYIETIERREGERLDRMFPAVNGKDTYGDG